MTIDIEEAKPSASAPASRTRKLLTVATLTRLEDAEALAQDWRALEARQSRPVLFQSADWCLHVWRARQALAAPDAPEPRVMVIRDGDGIAAIWPLAVHVGLGGRIAHDLTEPFGQYSDILAAPGADDEALLELAFAELGRWRIDGLVLRKVREDSRLAPWLAARGVIVGTREAAPEIALARCGGHEAYRGAVTAKTRKNLRNYRNRLGREGVLRHEVLDSRDDVAAAIARCFEGRSDWLENSGLSSTAFADPTFRTVVEGLTKPEIDGFRVVAMRLALVPASGAAIELSLHWGFEHGGRYYAYMASKNADFDAYSPGRLHLEDVIAALAGRGNETVDLLVPALPYKTSLATGSVIVSSYGVPFTMRGALAIRGWHGHLRPAMKAAMLRMPTGVRRVVMGGRDAIARLRA